MIGDSGKEDPFYRADSVAILKGENPARALGLPIILWCESCTCAAD